MRERQSGKGSFRKTLNNVEAELAGNESQETVLVTAHLDSTACDPGPLPCRDYDATNEPAPGTPVELNLLPLAEKEATDHDPRN